MKTDFSQKEILKAIRAVEIKAQAHRELSLESATPELREFYTQSCLIYKARLQELQLLLEEVSNEAK